MNPARAPALPENRAEAYDGIGGSIRYSPDAAGNCHVHTAKQRPPAAG